MTREEAIYRLKNMAWLYGSVEREQNIEAIDMAIEALQADAEDRLYIKIYADDEPSVKAEKLYQICGETQPKEVTEWLKEYFPALQESEIKTEQTETPTIQGKTPNFTEKHQLSEETSTPDLISRADAIEMAVDVETPQGTYERAIYVDDLMALPSAETHEKRTKTHGVRSDLISRQDIEWTEMLVADGDGQYHEEDIAYRSQIDSLPSADCDTCIYNVCNYNKVPWESNGELIDRQAALNELKEQLVETWAEWEAAYHAGVEYAISVIEALPSADREDYEKGYKDGQLAVMTGNDEKEFERGYRMGQAADRPPYRIDPDGTAWVNAPGKDLDKVGRVILDNFPYAKVFYPDRPRGKLIETESDEPCWYRCSECARRTDEARDYCPNCGCKMDGGVSNGDTD